MKNQNHFEETHECGVYPCPIVVGGGWQDECGYCEVYRTFAGNIIDPETEEIYGRTESDYYRESN